MSDDKKKMESFKIGDTQRPKVAGPKKGEEKEALSEQHSLGFRRIETILEDDDAAVVGESLNTLLQALEEFAQRASNNKDKAAAKKAIVAVERTVDLLDYLFQTKAQLQTGG